jgi:xylulokinase
MGILRSDGIQAKVIRAGNDNLFRSAIFAETVATLIGQDIEIYNTTGAIGAARACILINSDFRAFGKQIMANDYVKTYTPYPEGKAYEIAYKRWLNKLELELKEN